MSITRNSGERRPRSRRATARSALFASAAIAFAACNAVSAADVESPDGDIVVTIEVDAGGSPFYSVRFRDETVIAPSRLGLRFREQADFDRNLTE